MAANEDEALRGNLSAGNEGETVGRARKVKKQQELAHSDGLEVDDKAEPSETDTTDDDDGWKDPALEGLDEDEKKWRIVQMGFNQVQQFCDTIGLPHLWEMFIKHGFLYGDMIRNVTQYQLTNDFKMTNYEEMEAVLQRSADIIKDDDMFYFKKRYGDPTQLIHDCTKGRKFIEEHPHLFPPKDENAQESKLVSGTYAEKWGIPEADKELFNQRHEDLWIAATGCDGMIFLWPGWTEPRMKKDEEIDEEIDCPPCVRVCQAHLGIATDMVMDWDRFISISCGGDCRGSIYDLGKGKMKCTIKNNTGVDVTQTWLCIDGDIDVGKTAAGTCGGTIKIGDMERGKVVMVMKGHTDDVYHLKADWDRNEIVSCSWDACVNVYDVRAGKRVKRLEGHTTICNRLDVNFDQQLCLSVGAEDQFFLWDLAAGELIKKYDGHEGGNNDVSVHWDTMRACTGGEDGDIKLWDLESGECTKTIEGHHTQTLCVDVNWEKNLILTGSWDKQVKAFDLESGECVKKFNKPRRTLTQVVIKKDPRPFGLEDVANTADLLDGE